jgi:hypothetical protein
MNNLSLGDSNPLLEQTDEESFVIPAETDSTENPPSTNVEAPVETTTDNALTIARDKFADEFERLMREDSDFAHQVSMRVGNKARERYHPQITERDQRIAYLEAQLKNNEYKSLPETELSQRLQNDPEFRQEYDRVQTNSRPPEQVQLNPLQEFLNVTMTDAFENGFTQEDLATFKANIEAEKYYKDELGNPLTEAEWRIAARAMKRDIDSMTNARRVTTQPAPIVETTGTNTATTTSEPVTPPQHRDTASPDMSNGGNRGSQRSAYTLDEVRNMDHETRIKLWPTDTAYEQAIENGTIKLPE